MTRCPVCFRSLLPREVEPAPGTQDTCPACGSRLHSRWRETPTTCIALAGARTSGKTIFIAVMVKQLQFLAGRSGTSVSPLDGRVSRTFTQHYERPLYEERGLPSPTSSERLDGAYQREPLVFVIETSSRLRHHLVLRDVAGEDLEKKEDELDVGRLDFFGHADCVFFLYDPLKEPAIASKLRDLDEYVDPGLLGDEPWEVLRSVRRLIDTGRPRLALVMSKFDVVQALRTVEGGGSLSRVMANPGAALVRDPSPTGPEDGGDGIRLHHEVRSLLMLLEATPLVSIVDRAGRDQPDGARFFAVSALGGPPVGEKLDPRGIAPFRCLDPLRWAMADSGVV